MAKSASTAYVVTHSMVGPHLRGEVITFSDEDIKNGVNVDRLVGLGAIRPAADEDGTPVPFGDASEEIPVVFPVVPFDNAATKVASAS
jgi:hypothetical protein